jgi:hypothetical protein
VTGVAVPVSAYAVSMMLFSRDLRLTDNPVR